jgi:CubicO group peptidase (beta-lactamase class C family)
VLRFKRLLILALVLCTVAIVHADELPQAAPESVRLSSDRLAKLSSVLQDGVDEGEIPGYVALVARRGKIAYYESYGVRDPSSCATMSRDTIFRIYSMTKPITSVAVMILVEEGRLNLDDPIANYLPELTEMQVATNAHDASDMAAIVTATAANPITVLDLLRHTSGFTYAFLLPHPGSTLVEQMYLDGGANDLEISNAELVTCLSKLPLKYEPGTTWQYSRSTDVLGRLVEVVAGMTLEQFFQERILKPLDMKDSSFNVAPGKADRFAQPFDKDREGRILQYTNPLKLVEFEAGGQGLTSTVRDYARFLQMMLNGGELDGVRILGRKTVELMTMDHIGDRIDHGALFMPGQSHGFGLGFAVRTEGPRATALFNPMIGSVGEYYWAGYAGTYFWVDPKEELFAVYMMQSVEHLVPYAQKFKRQVLYSVVD